MKRYGMLLIGVATSAISSSVYAQNSESAGASASEFGDIVVTAQRRAERAQDVPIVISAFSPERLEQLNVTEPQDLYGTVPSLVSGTQGQAVRDVQSYSIRGQSTGFLASPGVQTYLNEVPVPSSISLNLQGGPGMFIDPESVQVLSGPQGTLFGRNTTGGAVLFTAKRPSNDFNGYIEGGIGNLKLRSVEGAMNVPIVDDKLMVRVAGAYQDRRGFTHDLVWDKYRDDIHYYTGRVGILFKPTQRIENYLLAYGTHSSNNGAGFVNTGFNYPGLIAAGFCTEGTPTAQIVSCNAYRQQTAIQQANGPRTTRADVDGFSKIETWGIINNTSFELSDEITLRNIVSYQRLKDNYAGDSDGTPFQQAGFTQDAAQPNFPIAGFADLYGLPATPGNVYQNGTNNTQPRDDIEQVTEELQLQGHALDDHLNYSVGGFYYNATPAGPWRARSAQFCPGAYTGQAVSGRTPAGRAFSCIASNSRSGVSNRSEALYAQATLDLGAFSPSLESLRLTAGYRYTWDRIKGSAVSWSTQSTPPGFTCTSGTAAGRVVPAGQDPATFCVYTANLKSSAPTWTFGLDYRPLRDLLVYGKVSRGYKAGGFNTVAVRPETTIFLPEKLTTYEVGFKSDVRLGSIPFRLNATYYYSNYDNIQRPGGDFNPANGAGGAAIFAAKATIQGIELESSIRPTAGVEIGGTFSYTKGSYKRYNALSFGGTYCNGRVPFLGVADYSCAPFQFIVPYIYNIYTSVDLPLPESLGKASLYVNYSHVSGQYSAPQPFEPGARLDGYGLLNASLKVAGVAGSGFDLTLFGNNLANKLFRVSNSNSSTSNYFGTLYGEPRTYGVRLRYRFGG